MIGFSQHRLIGRDSRLSADISQHDDGSCRLIRGGQNRLAIVVRRNRIGFQVQDDQIGVVFPYHLGALRGGVCLDDVPASALENRAEHFSGFGQTVDNQDTLSGRQRRTSMYVLG